MSRIKPILFNSDMVRAILDGRKTVTRRTVKFKDGWNPSWTGYMPDGAVLYGSNNIPAAKAPYQPGNIMYVRETWFYESHMEDTTAGEPDLPSGRYSHRYIYRADNPDYPVNIGVGATGWRPSIHMPKEAARIFLRVTDVRAERLQDITQAEAISEGVLNSKQCESLEYQKAVDSALKNGTKPPLGYTPIERFAGVWNSTIKKYDLARYGWDANPYVWRIEFERCEKTEGWCKDE